MYNQRQIGISVSITALIFLILGFMQLKEEPKGETAVLIIGGLILMIIGTTILFGKPTPNPQQ